jgi:hypothetical protein
VVWRPCVGDPKDQQQYSRAHRKRRLGLRTNVQMRKPINAVRHDIALVWMKFRDAVRVSSG